MADISKIALPNGTTYNLKDSNALTDDLFNMTPIDFVEVVDGQIVYEYFPASELSRIQHYRPFATNIKGIDSGGGLVNVGRAIWYCGGTWLSYETLDDTSNTRVYFSIGSSAEVIKIDLTTLEITYLGYLEIKKDT